LRRRQVDGRIRGPGADDDDRIETGCGKTAVEIGLLAQGMLDDGGVRPLYFNVLSDQQSMFVAGCNHQ